MYGMFIYLYLVGFYGKLIDNITFLCLVGDLFADSTLFGRFFSIFPTT